MASDTPGKSPGRVLVVDDQGVSRMLLCHYLEQSGFDTKAVTTCEEALHEVNNGRYEVILLDILMPGMGGLELLRILRTRFSLTELPILMVTSLTETEDKIKALELGANDYISKPVEPQESVARVRIHLDLHRMDRQLRESEERYALAVRGANEGLWDWNLKTNYIYYSPRFCSILEPEEEHAIYPKPQEWMDRIHPEDRKRVVLEIQDHLQGKTPYFESQHRIIRPDGTNRWVLARGLTVNNDMGEPCRMAGSLSDISHSLTYDNTTGLPSQHIFHDLLDRSMARVTRAENQMFGLLVVNIDDYATISDTLGVADTDKMLGTTSRRLQLASRASDIIARLKTAQFGVILDDIRQSCDAVRVARRIAESLRQPIHLADQHFSMHTSIGITVSSSGYDNPDIMLRDTEMAANMIQASGGNDQRMFDKHMDVSSNERLLTEQALDESLSRQQYLLEFMPVIEPEADAVIAIEPLLRWQRDENNVLLPDEFLPICEDTDIVYSIGNWVMRTAIRTFARWRSQHKSQLADTFLTINCSTRQFLSQELKDSLLRFLSEASLNSAHVKLEITEDTITKHPDEVRQIIRKLNDVSIGVGLDHYGEGRSSLVELASLNLAYVKLGRSIVANATSQPNFEALLAALKHSCETIAPITIITGIEDIAMADYARAQGFKNQMGYRYTRPVSESVVSKVLVRRETTLRLKTSIGAQG